MMTRKTAWCNNIPQSFYFQYFYISRTRTRINKWLDLSRTRSVTKALSLLYLTIPLKIIIVGAPLQGWI